MTQDISRRAFCVAAASTLLAACGNNAQTESTQEEPVEGEAETSEPQKEEPEATSADQASGTTTSKFLVAYYSRADENYADGGKEWLEIGHTKVMAGYIAEALGADQYEIVPVEPYPEGYDDCCDVALAEQHDDARPAIANALPDVSAYDLVFIGCPIWWGEEPMIVRTFLEGVELSGKVVVPFTTHGGSGLGSVPRNVASFAAGADVRDGYAVSGTAVDGAQDEVVDWAKQFALA